MSSAEETSSATEPDADSTDIVIDLSKPIKAYDKIIKTLTMRQPTGADLLAVGNPVIFDPGMNADGKVGITHDMLRVQKMIARLATPQIPSGSIEQMTPGDITACAWAITPFFIPNAGTT